MKQTAVEWLVEQIKNDINLRLRGFDIDKALEQAKEMEKEQHKKTWSEGMFCETGDIKAFEQYYNETFKSKYDGCKKENSIHTRSC